jgi:hypothetical protein
MSCYNFWTFRWPMSLMDPWNFQYTENPPYRLLPPCYVTPSSTQKHAVLTTLINHVKTLSDTVCLNKEIWHLTEALRQNSYNAAAFNPDMHQKCSRTIEKETSSAVAITHKSSRLLWKFIIQTVHIPAKNYQMLGPVWDDLRLKVSGVYSIPCRCERV